MTIRKYVLAVVVACLIVIAPHRVRTQNAQYLQGPLTVTNAAVITPLLCSDAGVCPGTPSWSTDRTINGMQIVVEAAPLRYRYDNRGVAVTTTNGMLANTGSIVTLQQYNNVRQLQLIATTAVNATVWITVVRQ